MSVIPTPTSPRSSQEFATTLVLDPQPSRLLRGCWFLSHGALFLSLLLCGQPPLLWLALPLALHGWLQAPRHAPRIVVRPDGLWSVPSWGMIAARPARGSVRTPWLVRAVLQGRPRRRVVVLARDSLSPDQWRRLQVLLAS